MSPLSRQRGLFWAIGGAAAFVALAASFAPVAQSTVASIRLDEQLAGHCPAELGSRVHTSESFNPPLPRTHPEARAELAARYELEAQAAADVPGLGPMIRTFYGHGVALQVADSTGPVDTNLVFRDGFTDHVELVAGPSGTGVWLPSSLANQHGVAIGDAITLQPAELPPSHLITVPDPNDPSVSVDYGGDTPLPSSTVPVSAIYADLPDLGGSPFWCGVPRLLPDSDLPMLLMDEALLDGDDLGFVLLNPSEHDRWDNLAIERPLADTPSSVTEAREMTDRITELQAQLATTPVSPDSQQTHFPPLDARLPAYESGLRLTIADAEARAAELRPVLTGTVVTVALIGAIGLLFCGVAWARRRRDALGTEPDGPVSHFTLGRRAATEVLSPSSLGVASGLIVTIAGQWWLVAEFPGSWLISLAGAIAALLAAVLLVAVSAGVAGASLALDDEFRGGPELSAIQ